MINCPRCQSDRIKKNGTNKAGTQQYLCKDCGRSFTGNSLGKPQDDRDRHISFQIPKVFIDTLKSGAAKRNITVSEYLQEILVEHFSE